MARKFKKGQLVKCPELIEANPDLPAGLFVYRVVRNLPKGLVELEAMYNPMAGATIHENDLTENK